MVGKLAKGFYKGFKVMGRTGIKGLTPGQKLKGIGMVSAGLLGTTALVHTMSGGRRAVESATANVQRRRTERFMRGRNYNGYGNRL